MKTVGVFEGKTHFSALIAEASSGAIIVVTKNGQPIAQIGPVTTGLATNRAQQVMADILASKATLGRTSARELIEEGRRY